MWEMSGLGLLENKEARAYRQLRGQRHSSQDDGHIRGRGCVSPGSGCFIAEETYSSHSDASRSYLRRVAYPFINRDDMDTEGHRLVLRGYRDHVNFLRQHWVLLEERLQTCNLVSSCVRRTDNRFFQTQEDCVGRDRTLGFVRLVVSDVGRTTHRIGMDINLVVGCVTSGTGHLANEKIPRHEAARF